MATCPRPAEEGERGWAVLVSCMGVGGGTWPTNIAWHPCRFFAFVRRARGGFHASARRCTCLPDGAKRGLLRPPASRERGREDVCTGAGFCFCKKARWGFHAPWRAGVLACPRGQEGAIAAARVTRAGSRAARLVVNWGGGGGDVLRWILLAVEALTVALKRHRQSLLLVRQ